MGTTASITQVVAPGNSREDKSRATMPSWRRKQSDTAKKRLQRQLYLAREDPGPVFDVSACEITDIPQGVYSLCKVLQKESLLAHSNWLTSLSGGGNFRDLANLRVLDLHQNELVTLPGDLGYLTGLELLNVSDNKLKELPSGVSQLKNLHTLVVHKNKLKSLPAELSDMESLEELDISENYVAKLPAELSQVRTLKTLTLDASHMTYPSPDVCQAGTEAIMQFLCQENGIVYVLPDQLKRDSSQKSTKSSQSQRLQNESDTVNKSLKQYEEMQEKKRAERVTLERQLQEDLRLQAEAAAKVGQSRKHLINNMAKDQQKLDSDLTAIQQKQYSDRTSLVSSMQRAEQEAGDLVKKLLELSEKFRRSEELLEKMEKERMEMEKWWEVRHEEIATLRKKDVLDSMEIVLRENAWMNKMIENALNDRDMTLRRTQARKGDDDEKLQMVLTGKAASKNELFSDLLKQETLQREAFEALLMQKDARHARIRGQIEMIEQELAQLTSLEVEQRQLKVNTQINVLAEKRHALTHMLVQLIEERDKREKELHSRLSEMERQKEDQEVGYWLVQFQRLMDRKPDQLINQEKHLEFAVCDILEKASVKDYIPVFARHRISIETMLQMTDEELQQIGVHEFGLRKSILRCIESYRLQREEDRAAAKTKLLETEEPGAKRLAEREEPAEEPGASAPPLPPEVTAHFSSECVVCMEFTSSVLFLPCGHICCCGGCVATLSVCPLCRAAITQKIALKQTRKLLAPQASQEG